MARKGRKSIEKSYQAVLTDSWSAYRAADGVVADASEFAGSAGSPFWSARLESLHGGRQQGVDMLYLDNGRLSLDISLTRGMGITGAWYDNTFIGWDSPAGEVVNPAHVNLESRGGLGWLDGFSETIVRCGLTSNGAPYEGGNLHGRIANIPASTAVFSASLEAPYMLSVSGLVREVCLFHEQFVLETEITTVPGANWFTIRDSVTNTRAGVMPMQMLYHCNYGMPFLEAGARFIAPAEWVCPRDEGYGAENVRSHNRYQGPGAGQVDSCYYYGLKSDRKGQTVQMLSNSAGDLALSQRYDLKSLPCFTLWKNEDHPENGYVTGLEPGTNYPNIYPYEKKQKRVVNLRSNKSWETSITFAVHDTRKEVNAVKSEIKKIQGKKKTEVNLDPLAKISPAGES